MQNIIDLFKILLEYSEKDYELKSTQLKEEGLNIRDYHLFNPKYQISITEEQIYSGTNIAEFKEFMQNTSAPISSINLSFYGNYISIFVNLIETTSRYSDGVFIKTDGDSKLSEPAFGEINMLIDRFESNSIFSRLRKYSMILHIFLVIIIVSLSTIVFIKFSILDINTISDFKYLMILSLLATILANVISENIIKCFPDVEFRLSHTYVSIGERNRKKWIKFYSVLGIIITIMTLYSFFK